MPLYHCKECHHEWEGDKEALTCDWCEGEAYVLDETTPLEDLIKEIWRERGYDRSEIRGQHPVH